MIKRSLSSAAIDTAVAQLAAGRMVVVVDDEDRENEGDLVLAAEHVSPAAINFMTRQAGGLICLALTPERCDRLGLRPMAERNDSREGTPFTVTVEARSGVTTGISVSDQAHTMRVVLDPASGPDDLVVPGHVHPLRARAGGVLERPGHTEAAVDLARLAGCRPAGVICEIQNEDGSMARGEDLAAYARRHELPIVSIAELIAHRRARDPLVERIVQTSMPTAFGDFSAVGYRSPWDGNHHVALVKGEVEGTSQVLVRIHSECVTGDVFHSRRCSCGEQVDASLATIEQAGRGVLVYLAHEGRGTNLIDTLRAYEQASRGGPEPLGHDARGVALETGRDYGVAAQILGDLGVRSVRLIGGSPQTVAALARRDLPVVAQPPAVELLRAS